MSNCFISRRYFPIYMFWVWYNVAIFIYNFKTRDWFLHAFQITYNSFFIKSEKRRFNNWWKDLSPSLQNKSVTELGLESRSLQTAAFFIFIKNKNNDSTNVKLAERATRRSPSYWFTLQMSTATVDGPGIKLKVKNSSKVSKVGGKDPPNSLIHLLPPWLCTTRSPEPDIQPGLKPRHFHI